MKPGRASRTAELVCAGRAFAHGARVSPRFDDPTAMTFLPEVLRRRVEDTLSNKPTKGLRERFQRGYLRKQGLSMAARTVAIDDAVRAVRSPQLVILGAGLDGRAWRMPELADVVVFEVDHPDSQRDKRAKAQSLQQTAREVRFVEVDFVRDSLEQKLEAAGHDAALPTTWIWEGVVMYLTPADVEATLAVVSRRSSEKSRLVIAYHAPALILHLVGGFLRYLGEPLRSTFTPAAMRSLLARYGFEVAWDDSLAGLGAGLSPEIGKALSIIRHMRIVAADRTAR